MAAPDATVVLHVFSGQPDPTWSLGPQQAAELERRLAALVSVAAAAIPPEPGLGYRGLEVRLRDRDAIMVRPGYVLTGGQSAYRDAERALERWLLDTAPPTLSELVRSIETGTE